MTTEVLLDELLVSIAVKLGTPNEISRMLSGEPDMKQFEI
jgi:hypothetical protein